MPTTIYDASQVTQRSRDKAIAQQIRQATIAGNPIIIPQAGYSSYLLGEVNNGNITYFRKVDGCTDINLSCNCTGSTTVTTSSGSAPAPGPSGGYTLTYNAGSGGSGIPPAPTTSYSGETNVPILGNTGFTRTNRTFGGWNTSIDGSGIYYPSTSNLTMPYADTILYAQWYNPAGTDYQVIYDGNGGTGTAPATVSYKSGQGVTVSPTAGSLANSSLSFYGWNTAANGLGTAYPVSSNGFTMPAANVILYAQWVDTSISATQYTLTYFGNGNTSGSVPPATSYFSGASINPISLAPIAKSGYTFLGWNTAADGSGLNYSNNASIVMDSDKSLYAQWVGGVVAKTCGIGSGGGAIMASAYRDLYRDNTNNTLTTIIQTQYSNSSGAPYGTGNGPVDTTHTGNMLNSYSRVELSQVAGVYTFTISYITNWTGDTDTQTSTALVLTGPNSIYWPTGQTIQDVTISNSPSSFNFSTSPTPPSPTPDGSVVVNGGCFTAVSGTSDGTIVVETSSQIIAFYITFNNLPQTTTRVAIGVQTRWSRSASMPLPYTYTLVYNRTRIELANGPTPVPITGTFIPTATSTFNSSV